MSAKRKTPCRWQFGLTLGMLVASLALPTTLDARQASLSLIGTALTAPTQQEQVSPAYRAGRQAGRVDAERNLPRHARSNRWTNRQDRRDYEEAYNLAYSEALDRQKNDPAYARRDNTRDRNRDYQVNPPLTSQSGAASVNIGRDNVVRWQAPATVRLYVQVDNEPTKLFAEGASGSQAAPWIESGHLYVFMARDINGNEVARDRMDLRPRRR
jgi:hypothetical protein